MCDLRRDAAHIPNDQASSYAGRFTPTSPLKSRSASRTVRSIYRPVRAQPVLHCNWQAKEALKVRAGLHPTLPH
eukprot:12938094-Prorocentrum_lima.AAC.1